MNHPRIYWAIVEEDGDYSSYSKTEICAYSNKEDAEKHLAAIEALRAKLSEACVRRFLK